MSIPAIEADRGLPSAEVTPPLFLEVSEQRGLYDTAAFQELQRLRAAPDYLQPETGKKILEIHRVLWESDPQPITQFQRSDGCCVRELPYWMIPYDESGDSRQQMSHDGVHIVRGDISSIPLEIRALQADIVALNYAKRLLHLDEYAKAMVFTTEDDRQNWLFRRQQELTRAMTVSREGQLGVYLLAEQGNTQYIVGTIGSVRGVHDSPVLDGVGHDGTRYGDSPSSLPTHTALYYDDVPPFVQAYLRNKTEYQLAETTRLCVPENTPVKVRKKVIFPDLLYATQFMDVVDRHPDVDAHIFNTPDKIIRRLAQCGYQTVKLHDGFLIPTPGVMESIHKYYFNLFSQGKMPNGQPYSEITEAHILEAKQSKRVSEQILAKYVFIS